MSTYNNNNTCCVSIVFALIFNKQLIIKLWWLSCSIECFWAHCHSIACNSSTEKLKSPATLACFNSRPSSGSVQTLDVAETPCATNLKVVLPSAGVWRFARGPRSLSSMHLGSSWSCARNVCFVLMQGHTHCGHWFLMHSKWMWSSTRMQPQADQPQHNSSSAVCSLYNTKQ